MNLPKFNNHGVTLIELLVAIAIVGVLASVTMFSIGNAQKKARDGQRKAEIGQILTALQLYSANNPSTPPAAIPFGGAWSGANGTVYMGKVPNDPLNGKSKCATNGSTACAYSYISALTPAILGIAVPANCNYPTIYTYLENDPGNADSCGVAAGSLNGLYLKQLK